MTPSSPNPDQPQTRYEVLHNIDGKGFVAARCDLVTNPVFFLGGIPKAEHDNYRFRDPQGVVWRVETTREFGPSDYGTVLQRGDEWKPTKASDWLPWTPQSEAVEVYGEECVLFYRRPAHLVPVSPAPTFNQPQPESEADSKASWEAVAQQSDPAAVATTEESAYGPECPYCGQQPYIKDGKFAEHLRTIGIATSRCPGSGRPVETLSEKSERLGFEQRPDESTFDFLKRQKDAILAVPPSPAPAGSTPEGLFVDLFGPEEDWTPNQRKLIELCQDALHQRDEARKELDHQKKINKTACEDWADTHTRMEEMAKAVGVSVESDGYNLVCELTIMERTCTAISSLQAQATTEFVLKHLETCELHPLGALIRDANEMKDNLEKVEAEWGKCARGADAQIAELNTALSATEAECAKLREERDKALSDASNARANLAHADEKIEELQDYIRSERDAAAARVAELSDSLRDKHAIIAAMQAFIDKLQATAPTRTEEV